MEEAHQLDLDNHPQKMGGYQKDKTLPKMEARFTVKSKSVLMVYVGNYRAKDYRTMNFYNNVNTKIAAVNYTS